jgi:hypothetical protein
MKVHPSNGPPEGAGVSLWERISRDPKYLRTKRKIQAQYGLPLPYDIQLETEKWLGWMGAREKPPGKRAKRGKAFLKDVSALFKRFEVPEAWHSDFIADIAGVSSGNSFEERSNPKFNLYRDSDGSWAWECIITPETDLTNPLILESIQRQQKEYAGDPPRPARDNNHAGRLDWRPVYAWHKSHPLFTIQEIAKKINYTPQVVRRNFAELEDDK